MKKLTLISTLALSSLLFFAACGEQGTTENVTNINQIGMEVVSSVKDLPKCTKDNEGEQALVKVETSVRVCVDGKWFATVAKDSSDNEFSCTTKELKDKSGLKIICNGDSIGVVLNGAKGETGAKGDKGDAGEQGIQGKTGEQGEQGIQGEKGDTGDKGDKGDTGEQGIQGDKGDDGAGCAIVGQTDSTVTIKCGEKSVVLNLGGKGGNGGSDIIDTLELDSEKIAISLDTLSGFSQKGPFLKGSTVLLYELSDGRTLKQTNGNFTSEITSDDGRYSFQSRDLVSQYALIVVDGKYWNEVTGKPTTTNIKLQAYTNMLMRKSANVNLLTHLEKNRVFYLVTKKEMTVRAAKKQAQAEIFKQFHIDTTGFKSESEDLDVFGKTDADAALLAISILLQGDGDETALSVLLTDISGDMEKDGEWNEGDAAATKAAIADWAMVADLDGRLATFDSNVTNWGLGAAPDFAKFVRRYASIENGLGVCGDDEKVGTVKNVTNANSKKYYAASYTAQNNKTRFICIDSTGVGEMWRVATPIEKDTATWGAVNNGEVRAGQVNTDIYYIFETSKNAWRNATTLEYDTYKQKCLSDGSIVAGNIVLTNKYVCDNGMFRKANPIEIYNDYGCTSYNQDTLKILNKDANGVNQYSFYRCKKDCWTVALDTLNTDSITDPRDGKTYKTVGIKTQIWMSENLNYEVENSYCNSDSCAMYGRYYTWAAAVGKSEEECGYEKTCKLTGKIQGVCPEGWHVPSSEEFKTLYSAVGNSPIALQAKGFWTVPEDYYGFSALPAGYYANGNFYDVGSMASFWSATPAISLSSYTLFLGADYASINYHGPINAYKIWGFSVRCIKD